MKNKAAPDHMVRVKLPDAAGYHCSPSGDNDYEDAYEATLRAAVPPGFEVVRPRTGHRWPVDSEGYTFVPLRHTAELPDKAGDGLGELIARAERLVGRLERLAEGPEART